MARDRGLDGLPPLPVELILSRALVVRTGMIEPVADLRSAGFAVALNAMLVADPATAIADVRRITGTS